MNLYGLILMLLLHVLCVFILSKHKVNGIYLVNNNNIYSQRSLLSESSDNDESTDSSSEDSKDTKKEKKKDDYTAYLEDDKIKHKLKDFEGVVMKIQEQIKEMETQLQDIKSADKNHPKHKQQLSIIYF